jgi:uncharacterized membrane protein YgcG
VPCRHPDICPHPSHLRAHTLVSMLALCARMGVAEALCAVIRQSESQESREEMEEGEGGKEGEEGEKGGGRGERGGEGKRGGGESSET